MAVFVESHDDDAPIGFPPPVRRWNGRIAPYDWAALGKLKYHWVQSVDEQTGRRRMLCGLKTPAGAYEGKDQAGDPVTRYVPHADDPDDVTCGGCRMKLERRRLREAAGLCPGCGARQSGPHQHWCGEPGAAAPESGEDALGGCPF